VTKEITENKQAYFYAFLAVLLWATVATAFKISLRYSDVLPLLFFASITSTGIFLIFIMSLGKITLLRTLSRQDYLRSAILGFANPFLYYITLLKAYSILRAQEAMTINWLWPITLVLFSIILLRQRIHLRSILAIVISFIGVFIIATRGDILGFRFTSPKGVFLALGSTVIWAAFWVYNIKDECDETVRLSALYIGLFEMGITFLVWLKALKSARTTAHVANLIYLVPFLSLIVIRLVLGEEIYFSTILGLMLIIAGIALQKIWS
jgi:drug/metabolite transporter (DMT)-like permease